MKGQEDAPFEILIGMIILTFVLAISYYLFEDYQRYQTEAKLEISMNNLANIMESVAQEAPGTKQTTRIDLSVPMKLGSTEIKYLTFRQVKDKRECLREVGLESCWVIEVHARDNWNPDFVIKRRYLGIPGDIKIDAEVETPSKEVQCDQGFSTCLKMVSFTVVATKEDRNDLKVEFK